VGFASERMRRKLHDLDTSEIRRHLPLPRVLEALFGLVRELFGVEFRAGQGVPVWHDDVRYFTLHRDGHEVASLYADFFAREGKRGGAWMDVGPPASGHGDAGGLSGDEFRAAGGRWSGLYHA
jgi:oligopeptidase A